MGENGIHHMFWDQSKKKVLQWNSRPPRVIIFLKEGTRGTRSRLALHCATVKPVCESLN